MPLCGRTAQAEALVRPACSAATRHPARRPSTRCAADSDRSLWCVYHSTRGELTAVLSGQADVPTHLWLFTDNQGEIEQRLLDVPPFDDGAQVVHQIE